jgi:hypothetical protein
LLVQDLKQQLEDAIVARTQAENQLMELRIAQKAVGVPTEVRAKQSSELDLVHLHVLFKAYLIRGNVHQQFLAVRYTGRQALYVRRGVL